jgi:methylmalonyl-CoA mutase N-terminal domain/subunit
VAVRTQQIIAYETNVDARRIWSKVLRERYGITNPRALLLRFHTQTSGVSLTWQQPLNNIIRTAIEALAAVLGGTQSLHTNSYDEALCLPTEEAALIAVRTQQIIAYKEYIAQKEWAYPPEVHLRIIRDIMEFCTKHVPKWNYISVSGYHIVEAGANAIQELAFTLMDGFTYVELGISAGLNPNEFAQRISFFFNSTMDFFEQIAKFRAARRIWSKVLRERYGVTNPRALLLRFHTQTSGVSLTWQQPLNNIIRTAIEALAAVLGGTQSLHTNSYDEALCLPTEEAALIAVRTQQIIAYETNIDAVIDPLAGSYYVEWLTDRLEEEAYKYFDKIEELGGMVEAIKKGYPQREIIENAYRQALKVENKESIIVGVNEFINKEEKVVKIFRTDPKVEEIQRKRIEEVKKNRDNQKVKEALEEVRRAFLDPSINIVYPILKAVKAYATLQEIMDIGREIYGGWKEPDLL